MAVTMEAIKTLRERTGAGMLDCKNALIETNGDVEKAADWLREKGIAKAAKKATRIAAEGVTTIAVNGNTAAVVEVNSETDFVAKNEKFGALVKELAEAMARENPCCLDKANEVQLADGTVADAIVHATATIGEKISFRRFDCVEKTNEQTFGTYIHSNKKIGVIVLLNGADKTEEAMGIAMHIAALAPQYVGMDNVPADDLAHEKEIQMANAKNDPKLQGKPEQALVKIVEGKVRKALSDVCLLEQDYVIEPGKTVGQYCKEHGTEVVKFIRYNVGEGIEKRVDDFAAEVEAQMAAAK